MRALLRRLAGGDRRSIGAVPQVVAQVLAQPRLFRLVFDGMANADPLVRMRCADAVEKITLRRPAYLASHKQQLIQLAQTATQQKVRWHIAQLLSRPEWNGMERGRVAGILFSYLEDESRIVKTFSMQALANIAGEDAQLRGPVLRRLRQLTRKGSPAMQSRGRKLLARLRK